MNARQIIDDAIDPKRVFNRMGGDLRWRLKQIEREEELEVTPHDDSWAPGQRIRRIGHEAFGARPFGGDPNDIGDVGTVIKFIRREPEPRHAEYLCAWDRYPYRTYYTDHRRAEAIPGQVIEIDRWGRPVHRQEAIDPKRIFHTIQAQRNPYKLMLDAMNQIMALGPEPEEEGVYKAINTIVYQLISDLERATGRRALDGTQGYLVASMPKPWNYDHGYRFKKSHVRELVYAFNGSSKKIKRVKEAIDPKRVLSRLNKRLWHMKVFDMDRLAFESDDGDYILHVTRNKSGGGWAGGFGLESNRWHAVLFHRATGATPGRVDLEADTRTQAADWAKAWANRKLM